MCSKIRVQRDFARNILRILINLTILKNLRILAIRDNDLVDVPQEIGELSGLRELHLQGNRLTVLPPSLGHLDFLSSRSILKLDNNPWVPPIEDQLMLGVSHVIEYIRTGDE